ncbi:ATP-binding protein [Niveispirillum fermenti]|uniref:ATP-binding protein n=1 Tax=Niveispirillum fermenti TaxID=1233113 RepID=UPI003A899137
MPPIVSAGGVGHFDRRRITVLFCDIVNSSQLVIPNDPEDVYDQLTGLIDIMNRHVRRFGGTVCQTLGDGIYAVFGAPVAQERHAVRACFAADAIVREVARGEHAVRIGLCSGEVLWDHARDVTQVQSPAVGAAIHVAAKLQQKAEPNSVLMAEATARLAHDWADTKPVATLTLAAGEMVETHALLAVRRRRRQREEMLPMVGRDPLRADLVQVLDAIGGGAGAGRSHLLRGEPGMGKTRLVGVLADEARQRGLRVVEWQIPLIHPVGAPGALQELVVELLDRPLPGTQDGTQSLLQAAGATPEEAKALARILHPAPSEKAGAEQATMAIVGLATAAVVALARATAMRRPLLVVVEDAHWADPMLLSVIAALPSLAPQVPMAVIITSRDEGLPQNLMDHPCVTDHRLTPVSQQDMLLLLAIWMGDAPGLDGLKLELMRRSHGNPFFLVEGVRVLVANGTLTGPDGDMCLGPSPCLQLPDSVQTLLVARTDTLDEQARNLLRMAAVTGPTFDAGLLTALTGGDVAARRLPELVEAGFLDETRLLPRLEYSFHHALLYEAVYAGVPRRERKELHGRLATLLDEPDFVSLPGRMAAQARHASGGGLWALAVRAGSDAGLDALKRSQATEALALFGIAVDANDNLPASEMTASSAIDLRLALARAAMPAGQGDRAVTELDKAVTLARRVGDQERALAGLAQQVNVEWVFGHMDRAVELADMALDHCGGVDRAHPDLLIIAAGCRFDHGNLDRALDLLELAERGRFQQVDGPRYLTLDAPTLIASRRARCLSLMDRHAEADALVARAFRRADSTTHPFNRIYARSDAAEIQIRQGRFGEALANCSESLALSRSTGSTLMDTMSLSRRGFALVNMGRGTEGLTEIERGIRMAMGRGACLHGSWARRYRVVALAMLGRLDEALGELRDLGAIVRDRGYGLLDVLLPQPSDLAALDEGFRQTSRLIRLQ